MADIKTKITIAADESSAKKLGRVLDAMFKPKSARELTTATKQLEAQFGTANKAAEKLAAALSHVGVAGTATTRRVAQGFKDLALEIKNAAIEGRNLASVLSSLPGGGGSGGGGGGGSGGGGGGGGGRGGALDTYGLRMDLPAPGKKQGRGGVPGGAEGRGFFRQSFLAGVMQGAGIGQYIPAGGLGARGAGMFLGGMAHRAYGMATAPFLMPGMGGLARALSAIPLVGQAAAGAAQTAASLYSQAVGYGQAAAPNVAYQAAPPSREARVAFSARAAARQRTAQQQLETLQREKANIDKPGVLFQKVWKDPRFGPEDPNRPRQEEIDRARAVVRFAREDWKGQVEKAQDDLTRAKEQKRLGWESGPSMTMGARFGIGPTQMQAAYGGFMGARGGAWDRRSKTEFQQALAAQAGWGVSSELSGGISRMGMRGGGGLGGPQMLAQVMQAAMTDGLKGSQVTEYLKELVDLGNQAEQTGMKIDERSFTRTAGGLSVAGFGGLQAKRVAGGFMQAAMQTGGQMVSPETYMLHRAFGYNPEGGMESWAAAAERMQEGRGVAEGLGRYASMAAEGIKGGGFGPGGQRQLMMQRFKALNVPISPGQAQQLLSGKYNPEDLFGDVQQRWSAAEREAETAGARLGAGAERRVGAGPTGILRGAAGMEAYQIGVGQRATWVLNFEKAGIDAANVINDFKKHLNLLSDAVRAAVKGFRTFASTWGL